MPIKILSDSACDLPDDILEEYDIDILPIIVIKDDQEYFDRITIKPKTVLNELQYEIEDGIFKSLCQKARIKGGNLDTVLEKFKIDD